MAEFSNWMLKIVIAKPMQLPMVSAEPTHSLGAFAALRAENCGESPTTTTPQNARKPRNSGAGAWNASGDSRQQAPEHASWAKATRALPARSDAIPPAAQPTKPAPMTTKDQNGTSSDERCAASATGTKAQNAYNSHMWPK